MAGKYDLLDSGNNIVFQVLRGRVDLTRLSEIEAIKVTDSSKPNKVIVNSTADPEDKDIDFHDNNISFREAIFIASFLQDKGHGDTTRIEFEDNPIEGSNANDLPPWLIKLSRPLPTVDRAELIVNDKNSAPSILFAPAYDEGGQAILLTDNLWTIGVAKVYPRRHGSHIGNPTIVGRGTLLLNRVSFTGFHFKNQRGWTWPGQFGGALVNGKHAVIYNNSEKDERKNENLVLKNVTFQNIRTLRDGGDVSFPSNSNIIKYNGKADILIDNIFLKNNSSEYTDGSFDPDLAVAFAQTPWPSSLQRWGEARKEPVEAEVIPKVFNAFKKNGDNSTLAKVSTSETQYRRSERKQNTRNSNNIQEARSYLYKSSIAELTPELPFILNEDQADIISLRYDRPTNGDITLFSDFSKLIDQVKTITNDLNNLTIEFIETSEAGTNPNAWQNQIDAETAELEKARLQADHDKKYAWVNAGVSLLSSVVGLNIQGAVPDVPPAADVNSPHFGNSSFKSGRHPGKLKTKWSTRTALYNRGASTSITSALGAFPAFAGIVMTGVNLVNKINQVDEALAAKEKQSAETIDGLSEYREKARANLNRVQDLSEANAIKMKEFQDGTFTPAVNLSTSQVKTQRTVIEIRDFEFGLDHLIIPQLGDGTIIAYEDFDDGDRGGFRVKVTDRKKDENEFVIADVYVSNFNDQIDYGKVARTAAITFGEPNNYRQVVGGALKKNIKQTKTDLTVESPLHATVIHDRSQLANNKEELLTTIGNSGHDVFYGTDGKEKIFGQSGSDTFYPYLGKDVIYGGTDIDSVVFDIGSPVQLRSVSASEGGDVAHVTATHRKLLGNSEFFSRYKLPFDSKLYSIETFVVSPFSFVDLSNLPDLEDERYKSVITAGVEFLGTSYDDVIDFNLPVDDIIDYLKHESKFTPQAGPLYANVDGGPGLNTLNLETTDLNGYEYRVKYGDNEKKSGMIYLHDGESHARELIQFQNISLITPSAIAELSEDDVLDIPLNDHDSDYVHSLDSSDRISGSGIEFQEAKKQDSVLALCGVDAAIYDHLVPLKLTAISSTSDLHAEVKVEQNRNSGISVFDDKDATVRSELLHSFETFFVPPYSDLDMQELPALSQENSYKYLIGPGVTLLGSENGEVIDFIFPEDPIVNYLSTSNPEFIPTSGPRRALIDGGDGPNVLKLSQENIPGGWEYCVNYNDDYLSGVVSLVSREGERHQIIDFANIGTIYYELDGVSRPVVMGWTNEEFLLPFIE